MAAPDEATIKHLEFLQNVISRLAQNGSVAKGWAVTVAGVFFAFAVEARNPALALASIATTVVFWGLDAYFLFCERRFRRLYDRVRSADQSVPRFFMNATASGDNEGRAARLAGWAHALHSFPVLLTYTGLVLAAVVVAGVVFVGVSSVPAPVDLNRDSPSPPPAMAAPPPTLRSDSAPTASSASTGTPQPSGL